ncbi:uncharacterized protein LOC122258401 [Penaeus japonicus]|uniref:uncharacterized protein LOC122258400 n=1 Tax=Penaeus japonicus TaxID=27405 RepID=UPI001C710A81|nr:uncharacterized protein LOC122258400 [Penaeus japonicus]XP_042880257.1 uncharacterized protein LOC122258401 [Penaeus japonicus]
MDNNNKAAQEEELEINTAEPINDRKDQRKPKPVTKLLFGGIPADPKDIGKNELCNTYSHHNPDIILINSHGLPDNERIKIFPFNIYQRNKSGERADGVAIAIKRGTRHRILDDFDQEFLAVEVETTRGPIVIATCYLPPRRPFLPYPDILRLLRLQRPMYLLGDLNARHRTLGATLDNNNIGTSISRLTPDYKRADWNRFKQLLEDKPVQELDGRLIIEIDRETNRWFEDIIEAKEASIPTTTYRTIPHPASSRELQLLQGLYRGIKELAYMRGWTQELRRQYATVRVRLTEACRELQNTKWANLTTKLSNTRDPKEFWQQLKTLMGNEIDIPPYPYDHQGNKVYPEADKEAIHRTYWKNIFHISENDNLLFDEETVAVIEEIAMRANQLTPDPLVDLGNLLIEEPLTAPFTINDINKVIRSMKNKAPGISQIRKTDITNLPPIMIQRLLSICNAALASGYFPSRFKTALVTLIPKAGKPPNRPENFRPISLLEIPGKILERLINNRLQSHLENNNLLNERQYGFRQSRGTTTAIAIAYEETALALANKKKVNIVLRDVAKAFDKVWHPGLQHRLLQLGPPSNNKTLKLSPREEGQTKSRSIYRP